MSVGDWKQKDKDQLVEWLHDHLVYGPVRITFEKKDGTLREMNCTLKADVLPVYEKKTETERKKNADVMSVFDLDKNEWRSFRIDSIQSIAFDLA